MLSCLRLGSNGNSNRYYLQFIIKFIIYIVNLFKCSKFIENL